MPLQVTAMIAMVVCAGGTARAAVYRSPLALAVSHDGKTLYVSDKTAGCIVVLDVAAGKKVREVAIAGEPNGLALSADSKTLYVALAEGKLDRRRRHGRRGRYQSDPRRHLAGCGSRG